MILPRQKIYSFGSFLSKINKLSEIATTLNTKSPQGSLPPNARAANKIKNIKIK